MKIYDDNYVDTIAVVNSAKDNGLDMTEVDAKLKVAGYDADTLAAWREWVHDEIKKTNPKWLPLDEMKRSLVELGAFDGELSNSYSMSVTDKQKKTWYRKALAAQKIAKKNMKNLYG